MVFWIIPYLVAYNISGTTYPNGFKANFEATARVNITMDDTSEEINTDVTLIFACTPKNLKFLDCKVNQATTKNYGFSSTSKGPFPPSSKAPTVTFDQMIDTDFLIEFDKFAIKEISFPTTKGFYRQSMLRSIAGNLNVGIDLDEKKFGTYATHEESISGYCDTIYNITKIPRQAIEKPMNIGSPILRIDAFSAITKDETISIGKMRNMKKCHKSTPYIFATDELSEADKKRGLRMNIGVTSSRSEILLGTNRFNSYTESTGILLMELDKAVMVAKRPRAMGGKTGEFIHVSLVSITPVTDPN